MIIKDHTTENLNILQTFPVTRRHSTEFLLITHEYFNLTTYLCKHTHAKL